MQPAGGEITAAAFGLVRPARDGGGCGQGEPRCDGGGEIVYLEVTWEMPGVATDADSTQIKEVRGRYVTRALLF